MNSVIKMVNTECIEKQDSEANKILCPLIQELKAKLKVFNLKPNSIKMQKS